MSQEVLEINLEAEEMGEAEGSETVRMEEVGMTGGTQSSAMEVNEEEEDEVVVVEEVKRGEMRKWAPSSPPKSSRKRVQAGTVTQMPAGSQVKGSSVQRSQAGTGTAVSMTNLCWRCVKHKMACIMLSGRAQCENCWVMHYRCSLVLPKDAMGGKGGALGSQKAKTVEGSQQAKGAMGSQTKGRARKARKTITLGKSHTS